MALSHQHTSKYHWRGEPEDTIVSHVMRNAWALRIDDVISVPSMVWPLQITLAMQLIPLLPISSGRYENLPKRSARNVSAALYISALVEAAYG